MADLFADPSAAEKVARPLADRLRPKSLAEVSGQDHLTGSDGILTRMIASGSLGSMIFWGPPGTGKTTVARLLAGETDLAFEQISAIFSGVADLKKVFGNASPNEICKTILAKGDLQVHGQANSGSSATESSAPP